MGRLDYITYYFFEVYDALLERDNLKAMVFTTKLEEIFYEFN